MTDDKGGRIETGVPNLDALLHGGIPRSSITVVGGAPGTGKTILAQQLCFHQAALGQRVAYFGTLSEPTAKTLRYLSSFAFFDGRKLHDAVEFIDLGHVLRTKGLEECASLLVAEVRRFKPNIVVIDSFKAFEDLGRTADARRKFGYEVAVQLMAWEATTLLLGEYGEDEFEKNPIFSVCDGLISLEQRELSGEQQRFLRVVKMRGTHHSRDEHTFAISTEGVHVYAPRVTIQRTPKPVTSRCKTGVSKLDDLVGSGIPAGSSLLVAGVSGTGKTMLLLEFVYRGALAGERGLFISFEETEQRLRATARGLGWKLEEQIDRGMLEMIFIPQPSILVDADMERLQTRIQATGAVRIAFDSVSVFLHKVTDLQIAREKVFQIATIVHNADAVALLATDVPYGSNELSRFGVEETVVDGIILLTSTETGMERERYVEVYKLRNTAHLSGRHSMRIGRGGIEIFPRYAAAPSLGSAHVEPPAARISIGVPGLDALMGGGLFVPSATLVSGSAGIGKTTMGLHFLEAGSRAKEPGLLLALEEGHDQVLATGRALGMTCFDSGLVRILPVSRHIARPHQLYSLLAERIRADGTRRLVLDSISDLLQVGTAKTEELRQMLASLIAGLKELGVTTLLTLEARSMFSPDSITEQGLSPVADNVIMMRYTHERSGIRPVLTVVKTRASVHDFSTYALELSSTGLRVGPIQERSSDARGGTGSSR